MKIMIFFSCLYFFCINAASGSEEALIKVIVTIQEGQGMTEDNLNTEMLHFVESWTKNKVIESSIKSMEAQGYKFGDYNSDVDSTSYYLDASGKRLGVIKVSSILKSNRKLGMKAVRVFGIVGNNIHTVGCIRGNLEEIPITFGECGNKIEEVFSIKFK
jgi:hypothetical protein